MTLLAVTLAIGCVSFAALWLDERLNRKTCESSATYWRKAAEAYERTFGAVANVDED